MMYGPESYKVVIFGDQYVIRTDVPNETIVRAAALVDLTMKEIARAGMLDTKSIAVLAALRLAHQVDSAQVASENNRANDELCKFIDLELEKIGIKL